MIQLITMDGVKAACCKAYKENRLIAQDPAPSDYGYQLLGSDDTVRVCAIGAALDDEAIEKINELGLHSCTISSPRKSITLSEEIRIELAFSWDENEKEDLMEIQLAHDEWLGNVRDDEYPSISEREFKRVIGL